MHVAARMNRRQEMTVIWMYFVINESNHSKADCKLCSKNILRSYGNVFLQYKPHKTSLWYLNSIFSKEPSSACRAVSVWMVIKH